MINGKIYPGDSRNLAKILLVLGLLFHDDGSTKSHYRLEIFIFVVIIVHWQPLLMQIFKGEIVIVAIGEEIRRRNRTRKIVDVDVDVDVE